MSQKQPSHITRSLYYGWLPQHPEIHDAFFKKHVEKTRNSNAEVKDPYVKAFIEAIKASKEVMFPLSNAMFDQLKIYTKNPDWKEEANHQVDSLDHLGAILDSIVETGPKFWKLRNSVGQVIGEPIGVPIYVALDLLSNTPAGYDLFRWSGFNAEAKKMLDGWGSMLKTDKSATVFNDNDGWFTKEGLAMLEQGLKGASFDETFELEIEAPQRYKTWDSFFTRKFRTDVPNPLRPIETLDRKGVYAVINNACESTSMRVADNVQLQDQFWLKGQNYSLSDMFHDLAGKYAEGFVGGSVYQAFLSPQDYHRWHSPITGDVVATTRVDGTYYAVLPDDGSPGDDGLQKGDPHGAIVRSQAWLSVSAARFIYIIEADANSVIDRVALIGIGMGEVSSTVPRDDLKPGFEHPVHVNAGDELGMFHFGGSTHLVAVKLKDDPTKQLVFKDKNDIPITPGQHRWINSVIARVEDAPEPEE